MKPASIRGVSWAKYPSYWHEHTTHQSASPMLKTQNTWLLFCFSLFSSGSNSRSRFGSRSIFSPDQHPCFWTPEFSKDQSSALKSFDSPPNTRLKTSVAQTDPATTWIWTESQTHKSRFTAKRSTDLCVHREGANHSIV